MVIIPIVSLLISTNIFLNQENTMFDEVYDEFREENVLTPKQFPIKKSEAVKLISDAIDCNVQKCPPNIDIQTFTDLEDPSTLEAAKKLKALKVLDPNKATFDEENLNEENFREFFKQAFDALQEDIDHDKIPNEKDKCPQIPGEKNDGCPNIKFYNKNNSDKNGVILKLIKDSPFLKILENTRLRIGDTITAVIMDTVNGEIFSRSNSITITE